MTMRFIITALIALAPATLMAQLKITVSPDQHRLAPGSRINFSATVPKNPPNATVPARYWVRLCPQGSETSECAAEWNSTGKEPGKGTGSATLTFNSFTVSSAARSGDVFCFSLEKRIATAGPNGPINWAPPTVVDHECRAVAVMNATVAGDPGVASGTGAVPARPTRALPTPRLPDLSLAFNPVQFQWIVRNTGNAKSAATFVRFHHAQSKYTMDIPVDALAPGEVFAIKGKPALKPFVSGTKAMVDPGSLVKESDKKNNFWLSPP